MVIQTPKTDPDVTRVLWDGLNRIEKEDRTMKKSRYTPEQVVFGLRQSESGTPVPEVCRKMGISVIVGGGVKDSESLRRRRRSSGTA